LAYRAEDSKKTIIRGSFEEQGKQERNESEKEKKGEGFGSRALASDRIAGRGVLDGGNLNDLSRKREEKRESRQGV